MNAYQPQRAKIQRHSGHARHKKRGILNLGHPKTLPTPK